MFYRLMILFTLLFYQPAMAESLSPLGQDLSPFSITQTSESITIGKQIDVTGINVIATYIVVLLPDGQFFEKTPQGFKPWFINNSVTLTDLGIQPQNNVLPFEVVSGTGLHLLPFPIQIYLGLLDDKQQLHFGWFDLNLADDAAPTADFNISFQPDETNAGVSLTPENFVNGTALDRKAYLFNGNHVEATANLGALDELTIAMNIYIDDLKEAETILLDTGSEIGNIKLSLQDNRASSFKEKEVALAFEVIGNTGSKVETKYRRFMEHERDYLKVEYDHERKINQLWLHLAVTYKAAENKVDFYINGIHDSTQYFNGAHPAKINNLTLGSNVSGKHKFYGKMSDVSIEKRALSDAEIYALADFRKDLWAVKYASSWRTTKAYYVDASNGNDANDGSEASPLQTLTAAVEKVNALTNLEALGTQIILKPGVYREGGITLKKQGAKHKPIVIQAETAGTVTISGSEILEDNDWVETSAGSGIWKHTWQYSFGRSSSAPSSIDLDTEVRYRRELVAVEGHVARPYPSLERLQNSTLYTDSSDPSKNASSRLSDDHAFYIDEDNALIYLRSTLNPNDSLIEIGTQEKLFSTNANYFVLKGITFKHAASFDDAVNINGKHLLVEDCNAVDNASNGMLFSGWGVDLLVRRGDFSNNGRAGIVTQRGYSRAYINGINVSFNQWRNDLSNYTGPDLSGYSKIMFSSRLYFENMTISDHNKTGIWVDAQNMDITMDNCYFTRNAGPLWYEINALNLGVVNSSFYDNNTAGIRLDSESIYLINNVISQSEMKGAWGTLTTLYYPKRTEQMVPDVYMAKWLTLQSNIVAISSGDAKLVRFDNSDVIGSTIDSANNIFYTPSTSKQFYGSSPMSFSEWQTAFNDTSSQLVSEYPFENDGSATVGFEQSSLSVDETQTTLEIPIVLSKAIDAEITLNLEATGMSATNETDFQLLDNNRISFRPLELKKIITVMLQRDYVDEADETFKLTLSNPNNATLAEHSTLTVTINASNETLTEAADHSHNAFNRIEAEGFDDYNEVNIVNDIGFGRFRRNHWAMYQNMDFGSTSPSTLDISIAVPNERAGRNFELRLDSPEGQVIATVTTIATDSDTSGDERSWDVFQTVSVALTKSVTGQHDLYIVNNDDYINACVVDWFVFKH